MDGFIDQVFPSSPWLDTNASWNGGIASGFDGSSSETFEENDKSVNLVPLTYANKLSRDIPDDSASLFVDASSDFSSNAQLFHEEANAHVGNMHQIPITSATVSCSYENKQAIGEDVETGLPLCSDGFQLDISDSLNLQDFSKLSDIEREGGQDLFGFQQLPADSKLIPSNWCSSYRNISMPSNIEVDGLQCFIPQLDFAENEPSNVSTNPLGVEKLRPTSMSFPSISASFHGLNGISNIQAPWQWSQANCRSQETFSLPQSQVPLVNGNVAAKPRARARRGQATDPHSIAERLRREKIAERMKNLQQLVPNANKTDKASMLDEIIEYVKFLQLQVKVLSMSRLGAADAVVPAATDAHSEGVGSLFSVVGQKPSLSDSPESIAFEQEVVKLMESNMTLAMQLLQTKGLCLMPIALATVVSHNPKRLEAISLFDAVVPNGSSSTTWELHSASSESGSSSGIQSEMIIKVCEGSMQKDTQIASCSRRELKTKA